MNPLPNRPLLSNQTMPLSLPNVPSLDQMAFNGRPRKVVPEVGKDFPVLNGMMSGSVASQSGANNQGQMLDRDNRMNGGSNIPLHQSQQQNGPQGGVFQQQQSQQQSMDQPQTLQIPGQQTNKEDLEKHEEMDSQIPTAIFRPDRDFKERLERARSDRFSSHDGQGSGVSAWDPVGKDDDEDDKEDAEMDEEDAASTSSEDDGKLWRTRRTLRKSVSCV